MRRAWWALAILGGVYLLVRLVGFALDADQHDFRSYYFAAAVAKAGISPYDVDAVREAAGESSMFPFFYPPYAIRFFSPFTLLGPDNATRVWLLLKTGSLIGLIWIWSHFLPGKRRLQGIALLFLFIAAGFHEAAMIDLKVGNVSTIEQLLLWAGFLAFLRGRHGSFAALVLAASFFKLLPIAFLGLLLFVPDRKGWPALAGGFLGFLAIHGLSYLTMRPLYQDFLARDFALDERGSINPCTLAAIRDVVPDAAILPAYAAAVILVIGLFLWRVARRDRQYQPLDLIVGGVLVLTLVAPRMKDYSYLVLFLPTVLYLLDWSANRRILAWVLTLLVLAGALAYQSLLLAFLLFLWWLVRGGPSPSREQVQASE